MQSSPDGHQTDSGIGQAGGGGSARPERKRTLVIGATGGVGAALIGQLLASGHQVIATVRTSEQIASIERTYPAIEHVFALDMADGDGVAAAIEHGLTGRGAVDAVVVCTGVAGFSPLEIASLADFRRTLEINTVSCLAVYQAVLPILRETKGRLILISSYAGKVATPFIGRYSASKFALEALGDAMRQEARLSGVRVVLILPGGIDTAMCDNMERDVKAEIATLSPEIADRYGHYYHGHLAMLMGPGKSAPEQVGAVVQQAIEADQPETRYVIGDGANWFIQQREELGDEQFDALAEGAFHQALGAA